MLRAVVMVVENVIEFGVCWVMLVRVVLFVDVGAVEVTMLFMEV